MLSFLMNPLVMLYVSDSGAHFGSTVDLVLTCRHTDSGKRVCPSLCRQKALQH